MAHKAELKGLNYHKVSKKSVVLWEILFFICWTAVLWLLLWAFSPFTWLWYLLVWMMGVLLILAEFLYLPVLYQSTGYFLNDRLLAYQHGYFFHKQQIIHRDRIIYVSVINTPVTPILGISSLVVATAGAKLRIPYLNRNVAKHLAEQLSPSPKEIY